MSTMDKLISKISKQLGNDIESFLYLSMLKRAIKQHTQKANIKPTTNKKENFKIFNNNHMEKLDTQLNKFVNDPNNKIKIKQIINITKDTPTVLVWYENIIEEVNNEK